MSQYLVDQYAESNVHPIGLSGDIYPPNEVSVARNITKYQPRSINNNATAHATICNLSGQIEFNFNTSNMQWLDLFDSYFITRYTMVNAGANTGKIYHLTQNLIGQAYLYVNGVQVAFTNNWSVASKINKRMQFSKQYNETVHEINYRADVVTVPIDAVTVATGGYTDKENLDGFFIRDKHSCWIPPNCEIRLVIIVDPAAYGKASRGVAGAASTATYLINSIEFVASSLIRNIPGPIGEWVLKLVTNSITTSTVALDCNRQLTVSPNIMKVAIAFQDSAFSTLALNKVNAGDFLRHATQTERTDASLAITPDPGAQSLQTLQLQLGSIVNPPQAYNLATNLHREVYEQYMQLTGKSKVQESSESFVDWCTEPIFLFDFPRPDEDKSTNLIVRATRMGNLTPLMHVVEMDLSVISMKFDPTSGAVIETTVN